MPVCPHCSTHGEHALTPCPTGDGFYLLDEREVASFRGDKMLGRAVSGRYVINGVIGRGAIGRVYKAWQMGVEREVVVKLFKLESLVDEQLGFVPGETLIAAREDARERFIREARVLGQLSHPNCVTLYDFGYNEDGSFLYIAMEYALGMSLRKAVKRGLRGEAVVEILLQILRALRQAHAMNIVHRDLKPENIILSFLPESNEPVVKVLDFGIAKLVGKEGVGDGARTSAGMLFGTPAYMSPEQCRGETDTIGPPTDIYSFGCLAYELITGRLPFDARLPQRVLSMHQDAPVPPIVLRDGLELPAGLEAFILKCLCKDPSDRYDGARQALRVLDALASPWERPVAKGPSDVATSQELDALKAADVSSNSRELPAFTGEPSQALVETGRAPLGVVGETMVRAPSRATASTQRVNFAVIIALASVAVFCALLFYVLYLVI